jgi:hypothetical protein
MGDYISGSDAALTAWLYNLVTGVNLHLEDLGLVDTDVTPVQAVYTALNGSVTAYTTKRTALTAASNDKKNKRADTLEIVRPFVQRIQHAPAMTDEIRGELGLPVRAPRTTHSVELDVPGILVETIMGHAIVHFGTQPTNERLNNRPAWAQGCNIYRKRAGDTEYTLMGFQKASPYTEEITGEAEDYTYVVRYRGNKAQDIGAQSAEVTIAARGMAAAA